MEDPGLLRTVAHYQEQLAQRNRVPPKHCECAYCGKDMGPQFCCPVCREAYSASRKQCATCEQPIRLGDTVYYKDMNPHCSAICRDRAPDDVASREGQWSRGKGVNRRSRRGTKSRKRRRTLTKRTRRRKTLTKRTRRRKTRRR